MRKQNTKPRKPSRLKELEASFEIRWKADQRAIKLWQTATGKTLEWPGHKELCLWLMEQLEESKKLNVAWMNNHNTWLGCIADMSKSYPAPCGAITSEFNRRIQANQNSKIKPATIAEIEVAQISEEFRNASWYQAVGIAQRQDGSQIVHLYTKRKLRPYEVTQIGKWREERRFNNIEMVITTTGKMKPART